MLLLRKTLSVLLAGATLLAVPMAHSQESRPADVAKKTLDDIQREGQRKNPNASASDAMREEAIARSKQRIASEPDPRKRKLTAASNFMGFYLVNTRERVAFCRELGVDIPTFASPFTRSHTAEVNRARATLAGTGFNEDQVYTSVKTQLRRIIQQDMQDIATANKQSLADACRFINQHGEKVVENMHFSKVNPTVHEALMRQ